MQLPLSELADRLTILKLKVERLPEQDNTISAQFAIFVAEVQRQLDNMPQDIRDKIKQEIAALYEANKQTWDLEYDIRRGELGEENLAEIGRRALLIRKSNGIRLMHKNKIANLSCDNLMFDKKIDHSSQEMQ